MTHVSRGTVVLLALFAAGLCGISLETMLFDEPRQPAAAGRSPSVAGIIADDPTSETPIAPDMQWDTEPVGLQVSYAEPDTADASSDQPSNVMMHPKVQLWNGQGMSESEPRVCRCKTRCARRWVRCRVR